MRSVRDKLITSSGGAGRLNLCGPLPFKDSGMAKKAKQAEGGKTQFKEKGERETNAGRTDLFFFLLSPLVDLRHEHLLHSLLRWEYCTITLYKRYKSRVEGIFVPSLSHQ